MLGALALIVELIVFYNPRYHTPPRFTTMWTNAQTDKYQFEVPQPFRRASLPELALGVSSARESLRILEGVHIEHSWRAKMRAMVVSFRTQESGEEAPSTATMDNNAYEMARRAHQEYLSLLQQDDKLRQVQAKQTDVVQVNQTPALRTNYSAQLQHRLPTFEAPVDGFVMTFPISANEALIFHAHYPRERAKEYRPAFARIVKSFRAKSS